MAVMNSEKINRNSIRFEIITNISLAPRFHVIFFIAFAASAIAIT